MTRHHLLNLCRAGFQGVTGLAFVQLDDSGESREALPSGAAKPERIPIA